MRVLIFLNIALLYLLVSCKEVKHGRNSFIEVKSISLSQNLGCGVNCTFIEYSINAITLIDTNTKLVIDSLLLQPLEFSVTNLYNIKNTKLRYYITQSAGRSLATIAKNKPSLINFQEGKLVTNNAEYNIKKSSDCFVLYYLNGKLVQESDSISFSTEIELPPDVRDL
jgi:hypothetical protein